MKRNFFCLLLSLVFISVNGCIQNSKIDRFALVTRHNIENKTIDSLSSLSVGNGEFAFTVDITGLQTFPEFYSRGISLGTMSGWGWHTGKNPENLQLSDVYKTYNVHGRNVDYIRQFRAGEGDRKVAASNWLRANPHRIHLGMIGLQILKEDGTVDFSECTDPRATELERRVILSQYVTRIQCSGSLPPAETGLTYNSWFGKFHLEIHWWHAVHFALWQLTDILEKQMGYYFNISENAKKTAEHQGYDGVR